MGLLVLNVNAYLGERKVGQRISDPNNLLAGKSGTPNSGRPVVVQTGFSAYGGSALSGVHGGGEPVPFLPAGQALYQIEPSHENFTLHYCREWAIQESNLGPRRYQRRALTS